MMSALETGYFVWNFSAWIKIFLLSAGIFSLLIFLVKKRTGGNLVSNKMMRGCRESIDDCVFEREVASLRSKIIGPWLDLPFLHLISMFLLFLLFAVALFSKSGVE